MKNQDELANETQVTGDGTLKPNRRQFMQLAGASAAVATASMPGCIRKPVQHIVPFVTRPEDLIPGKPNFYATAAHVGENVLGLIVESHDGRPTKIEGNPVHPMSEGSTDTWTQAAALDIYDPNRGQEPLLNGNLVSWDRALSALSELGKHIPKNEAKKEEAEKAVKTAQKNLEELKKTTGAEPDDEAAKKLDEAKTALADAEKELEKRKMSTGLAILTEWIPSPTIRRLMETLEEKAKAKIYVQDPAYGRNRIEATEKLKAKKLPAPLYGLDKAKVILSVDSDFLGLEGDRVRNARLFAQSRAVSAEKTSISRLYVVETNFSSTGACADNRLRLLHNEIGAFLASVAAEVKAKTGNAAITLPDAGSSDARVQTWAKEVAADLVGAKGESVVMVGENQGAHVHALAMAINEMIGAYGKTITYAEEAYGPSLYPDVDALAAAIENNEVKQLVILGANPAYNTGSNKDMAALIRRVPLSIHVGMYRDETGKNTTWHIPRSHFLESWGDLLANDGTTTIQQPLIDPLYGTPSTLEVVARLAASDETDGRNLIQGPFLKGDASVSDRAKKAHQEAENAVAGATQNLADAKTALKEAQEAQEAAATAVEPAGEAPADVATDGGDATDVVVPPEESFVDKAANEVNEAEAMLKSANEALAETADAVKQAAEDLKTAHAKSQDDWRLSLTRGVQPETGNGKTITPAFDFGGLAALWSENESADGLELHFALDARAYDGRFANNPWLQELPDPITKLTWDNAALMNSATAHKHDVGTGDMVHVRGNGHTVMMPVLTSPGIADNAVILNLGYGRSFGSIYADKAGFDVHPLRTSEGSSVTFGASINKAKGSYELATVQTQGGGNRDNPLEREQIQKRIPTLIRSTDIETYKNDPVIQAKEDGTQAEFVNQYEVMPKETLQSLWEQPNTTDGQQWGLSIDLNACNGCGACTIACQAENNIPIVGKEEVLKGRELHWIRIDRYYAGPEDNPSVAVQPVGCAQCETAPCENVCPVAATAHSPEGLNDMAYNRCIGTRYCANNCPYKVRRFNFFNYTKRMDNSHGKLVAMQRNPDVTVRFRGVMEKCSYCVQRITEVKIIAKRNDDGKTPDGHVADEKLQKLTACAQVCPTDAIVFGDINNPESAISEKKRDPRTYTLLSELNLHARTSYQAKIHNPNPKLVEA